MNAKSTFTAEYGGGGGSGSGGRGGAPFMWPQQVSPVVPPSPTIAGVAAMQATNTNSNSSSTSNLGIFPYRLHQILADAENDGLDHVISWVAGGTLFKVHSPDSFTKLIMNRYFRHDRYKSFLRQLSMYKFVRVTDGPFRGAYGHPQFLKDRIELSRNISRGDKDEDQQGQSPKTTKTVTKKISSKTKTKKMPLPPSPSMKTATGSTTTISGGGFALSSGMGVTKPYHQNPVTHYYERPSSFGETLPVSSQSSIRNTTLAHHDATTTTGFNPSLMNGFGGVDGSASSSSIITSDILDEIISTFGGGSASVSVCDTTTATRSHSNSFSSATQMDESFTTITEADMNLPTVPVAVPNFYHGSNASAPY